MKKIALALALLLIFSLLASCNEGDTPPEVTTTAETTTAATTTVATTTAKPEPTDGITVGMSREEALLIVWHQWECLTVGNVFYFIDSNGENVVLVLSDDKVESVYRCAPVEKPQLSYDELLQTKLTPEEALSKLGAPMLKFKAQSMEIFFTAFRTSDNKYVEADFDAETGKYSFTESRLNNVVTTK
ncbi:MAG: hypothetical protein E7641_05335 [Ruminococcaceae bacterium]|nr:hypothetical protein [Oscillospiraceae bacterium]